jgi:hypothetical protein
MPILVLLLAGVIMTCTLVLALGGIWFCWLVINNLCSGNIVEGTLVLHPDGSMTVCIPEQSLESQGSAQ